MQSNKLIIFLSLLLGALIAITWQVAKTGSKAQLASVSGSAILQPTSEQLIVSFDSAAALAVDGSLKKVFYAKNRNEKRPIASLTKLFSAAVVWENYDLTKAVAVSEWAVREAQKHDGVRVDLVPGDKIRVFDLLSAMVIDSSNEAAYALAESWPKGGSTSEEKLQMFVLSMNKVAHEAGLSDTALSDPAGLDDAGGNYSTAADLAKFAQWLKRYPALNGMSIQKSYSFYSLKGNWYNLKNPNQLIGEIEDIVLTKTGYTEAAGQSILIEVAWRPENLIVVLLGAEDRFENAKELIEKIDDSHH